MKTRAHLDEAHARRWLESHGFKQYQSTHGLPTKHELWVKVETGEVAVATLRGPNRSAFVEFVEGDES